MAKKIGILVADLYQDLEVWYPLLRLKEAGIHGIIGKPFKLILDKLYGSVIEGDKAQGYSVSFVYKEVAKKQLSFQEQREIYDIVSTELLKPEGKTLNAIEVTDGILYAILANRLKRAFYWTIVLLQSAINQNLPKTQIHYIISRIELVAWVNPPDDLKLLYMYYAMLFLMAIAYSHIEEDKKALDLLNKIEVPSVEWKGEDLKKQFILINGIAKIYHAVLVAKKDPLKSIKILSEIDFAKIKESPFSVVFPISDFFSSLVSILSIKEIPQDILKRIVNSTDLNDGKAVANLVSIASSLGVKADQEGISVLTIKDENENQQVLDNIFASLKQDGVLIIELMGKEVLARIFQERDWSEKDGLIFLQERSVRDDWSWIDNRWMVYDGKKMHEFTFGHWVYSASELKAIIKKSGFGSVKMYGNLAGAPYDQRAEKLIAVARK